MKYTVFSASPLKQKGDTLVLGLFDDSDHGEFATELDHLSSGLLERLIGSGDVSGEAGKSAWIFPGGDVPFERVLCVGLGKLADYRVEGYRKACRAAATALAGSRARQAVVSLPTPEQTPFEGFGVEALVLAQSSALYRFEALKSSKKDPATLAQVKIHTPGVDKKSSGEALSQAVSLATGVSYAKDLANLPGNHCTPKFLAKQARKLAKDYRHLSCETLGEKEMKELGMGAFLAVSAGSEEEGQLIVLHYKGGKSEDAPYVLVGKGITFDTGGISLKPGEAMDEMKYDMCGAASVLGTLLALADMEAPINVVGLIAAAENMPSGKATKPGDIVTSLSGQTIEILNTDAEGRLVLCDALTYAERFKPIEIVDIATLTGACVIALGAHATGLMANDDEVARKLLEAGERSGDRCWRLPLWDEYNSQLDSNFADMQNIGGRPAGAITAAAFLGRYTKKMKWAHLDIAGTAWLSGKDKGATGRPVPLLTHYLLRQIAP